MTADEIRRSKQLRDSSGFKASSLMKLVNASPCHKHKWWGIGADREITSGALSPSVSAGVELPAGEKFSAVADI
jgi:hypothetical protein